MKSPSPAAEYGATDGGGGGRSPNSHDDDDERRRSPSPREHRHRRRSLSRSRSRSYSRSRSRSPPAPSNRGRTGGGTRSRSSRSYSRSRSPPPENRGGRIGRDRDYRGDPKGPDYYDVRGGRGGYGHGDYTRGGPPDPYHDRGPRDQPRNRGGPPPPPRNDGDGGDRGKGGGRRRGEGLPGISLLVRNVAPHVTSQDLQMAFGRIGDVRDVYIPKDYHSNQPKGFAFIEYANLDMARESRDEMNHFRIKGCELEVVFAQEKRKSPNEMRGRVVNTNNRGGGRGGGGGGRDRDRGRDRFERSSSFERHRQQRRREEGSRRDRDGKRNKQTKSSDAAAAAPVQENSEKDIDVKQEDAV